MGLIKRWLGYVVLVGVLLFAIFFALQNDTAVPLDLLIVQLPAMHNALWIMLAFALGGVAGLSISAVALVRLRSRNALLQRRLDKNQQELSQLRNTDLNMALGKPGKATHALPK